MYTTVRQMICILLKFIHIGTCVLPTHEKFLQFFCAYLKRECITTINDDNTYLIWLIFQVHENEFLYCILKGAHKYA